MSEEWPRDDIPMVLAIPIDQASSYGTSYGSIVRLTIDDQIGQNGKDTHQKQDDQASACSSSSWVSQWSGMVAQQTTMMDPRKVVLLVVAMVLVAYLAVVYAVVHWDGNSGTLGDDGVVGENKRIISFLRVMEQVHFVRHEFG